MAPPRKTRSAPQPARTEDEKRENLRRTRSLDVVSNSRSDTRRRIFQEVIIRLNAKNIELSRFAYERVQHLLPKCETRQQQKILQLFMQDPMLVKSRDLGQIFDLELSTAQGPLMEDETANYYIREWETTCGTLKAFCEHMIREDLIYAEVQLWLALASSYPEEKKICVRYVGHVEGPRYPYQRYKEDLTSRTAGIMHHFVHQLEATFPEVAASAKVWRIKQAAHASTGMFNSDDIERFIIAMFHQPTLLNRQAGGFYISFVPTRAARDIFDNMNTDFHMMFNNSSRPAAPVVAAGVKAHFRRVQKWANDNPHLSGTAQHEFSDELCATFSQQGTPRQINGRTISLFLGKDIPLRDYLLAKPFLDTRSRTENLVRDFLRRLCKWESKNKNVTWYDDGFDPSWFCFTDMWCTLWHWLILIAIQFLREYFRLVRPLVVTVFSMQVNNVTMGNFLHQSGVPGRRFLNVVGIPSLQHYDRDATSEISENDDDVFINLPSYHPGFDKYGPQDEALRRVYDLTFYISFLLNYITLVIVLTDKERAMKSGMICLQVMKEYHAFMEKPLGKQLSAALETAKAGVIRAIHNRIAFIPVELAEPSSVTTFPTWVEEGVQLFEIIGVAEGVAHSVDRLSQVDGLWDADVPSLHLVIPHDDQRKQEWRATLDAMPQGGHLLLYAMAASKDITYIKELLDRYRPASATADTWFEDAQALRLALSEADAELNRKIARRSAVPVVFQATNSQATKAVTTQQLDGLLVNFDSSSKLRIRWKRDDGTESHLRLLCKAARQLAPADKRTLHFTGAGIDIHDQDGMPIRPTGTAATIESRIFLGLGQAGPKVQEMWETVCKMKGIETEQTPPDNEESRPWPTTQGVDLVWKNSKTELPKQNRPPLLADCNHLLVEFLDRQFPDGGIWHSVPANVDSDSTDDTKAFVEFLKEPKYRLHPYQAKWIGLIDRTTPQNAVIAKNIAFFRRVAVESGNKWDPVRKTAYRLTQYTIGAPGTEGYQGDSNRAGTETNDDNWTPGMHAAMKSLRDQFPIDAEQASEPRENTLDTPAPTSSVPRKKSMLKRKSALSIPAENPDPEVEKSEQQPKKKQRKQAKSTTTEEPEAEPEVEELEVQQKGVKRKRTKSTTEDPQPGEEASEAPLKQKKAKKNK